MKQRAYLEAIWRNDVGALRALLPHVDVNSEWDEHNGRPYRLADDERPGFYAWHASPAVFELLCRAGLDLKKTRCPPMVSILKNIRPFLFYGGQLKDAVDFISHEPAEIEQAYAIDRAILSCRTAAVAIMALKRFRRHNWFVSVDRFLVRELALEIWRTRMEENWQSKVGKFGKQMIEEAAARKRLYAHARAHLTPLQWVRLDLITVAVKHSDINMLRFMLFCASKKISYGKLCQIAIQNCDAAALELLTTRVDPLHCIGLIRACLVGLPATAGCLSVLMCNVNHEPPLTLIPYHFALQYEGVCRCRAVCKGLSKLNSMWHPTHRILKRIAREVWATRADEGWQN